MMTYRQCVLGSTEFANPDDVVRATIRVGINGRASANRQGEDVIDIERADWIIDTRISHNMVTTKNRRAISSIMTQQGTH